MKEGRERGGEGRGGEEKGQCKDGEVGEHVECGYFA